MISQKNRFSGHKSLDYTYKHGKSYRSGSLSLKIVPARGDDYRLAVVISKKVSKSAVTRNRIRRRIFEQLRKAISGYEQPFKYDMIISVFDDSLATIPAEQLAETCRKLLASAGLKLW